MTTAPEMLRDKVMGVAVAERPEDLTEFLQADCAATLWPRRVHADFQSWVDGLDPSCLPHGRLILRPEAVLPAVSQLCASAGSPDCPHRLRLIDDVAALADIFADLMGARWLRLRFDVVTGNACRKFHIDAVRARLVCTYRGTGTQYASAENGQEPTRIATVPTGTPILLRGTLWPAQTGATVLHRSPPIEGTGETRLVLVLDPIDDPETAL